MSFRIDRHKPLENEFRRVMVEQLARAIKDLNQSSPALQSRAIHNARKRIKKVRTVVRLLHMATPRGMPKAYHTPLRNASGELATMRDARVDVKTMTKLCKDFSIAPVRVAGALEFLEGRKRTALANAGEVMHETVILLNSVRLVMEKWENSHLTWHDVCKNVAGVYKRGCASFRIAADGKSAENLHRWRRRMKDILYILLLLKTTNARSTRKIERQIRKLCSLLGSEHNLVHLGETLDAAAIGVQRDMLDELIGSKRLKLQGKAMKLGSKFFANKPKDFSAKCIC